MSDLVPDLFSYPRYVIKRPWLSFLERRFFVYGADGREVLFVKHPVMAWRERFDVFTDSTQTVAVFHIQARQIVALDYVHDVVDARTGERVASFKRRGWRSIIRDAWDILDAFEQPIGQIEEQGNAILRRFIPLLTSRHQIVVGGQPVASVRQKFRFFIKEFHVEMGPGRVDPRLALAGALLAVMAEVHREDRQG